MKKSIISTMALFLACAALTFTTACDSDSTGSDRPADCYGKCDGPPTGYVSPYEADLAKVMQIWLGPQIDSIEQAYTVQVDLGEIKFGAPTHLFGVPVNIIPYSNDDGVTDAEGSAFPMGDQEIAQFVSVVSTTTPPSRLPWHRSWTRPA